jgi:hypothetical protein
MKQRLRGIQHAVWLKLRFMLRSTDTQDILAERDIIVSHETSRRWVIYIGPIYGRRLRTMRPTQTDDGILMESSCQLPVDGCINGAPSMMKARPSMFSVNPGATRDHRWYAIAR